MSQSICFIAFGTFGNPNGFKQTFFIGGNAGIAKRIKTFDLKTDAIQLFPGSRVYSIRKELMSEHKAVSYSVYTYAKEPGSDRGGTFIGSSILYLDAIAGEGNTIACLNDFHKKLVGKNTQNDVISVAHSDQFAVSKPAFYEKLAESPKEIEDVNFAQSSHKNLVVYSDVSVTKLQLLFAQALPLLDVYDTLYFTASKEVAEFVHQKNLFQLVQGDGFEQELTKWQEEQKQYTLSLVAEYETEKQKLEADKKRVLLELKEQIDSNEKIQKANAGRLEEAKQELTTVAKKYESYAKKIEEAIRQLTAGKKPHSVKQLFTENRRIFVESVNGQKPLAFLNTIPKAKAVKTDLKVSFQPEVPKPDASPSNHSYRREPEYRLDRFKIASAVLLLLWMGTLAYFLLIAKPEDKAAELPMPVAPAPAVIQPQPKPAVAELNPKPNGKLGEKALRAVLKRMPPHASADSVVKVIFDNNADDVRQYYATQKEAYKLYLIQQNEAYFEKKDSTFYLATDTLATIPSYKAQVTF